MLKHYFQHLVDAGKLDACREEARRSAASLGIAVEDLAAVLLYLNRSGEAKAPAAPEPAAPAVKMVRYRLSIGSRHKLTSEQLIRVLINESGVDKRNICNINIQHLFTLVDLPDCMPQDIFLHLKTVEINRQKLDIKRVKPNSKKRREKKRVKQPHRPPSSQSVSPLSDYVNGG